MKNKKGFSIIELLVVVGIIGVLSSVVLGSFNSARTKARDAKRLADMGQIQLAMALYYDVHGVVPYCGGTIAYCCSTGAGGPCGTGLWTSLGTNLAGFIPSLSVDPINSANNYGYYYARGARKIGENRYCTTNNSADYVLATRLEGGTGSQIRSCGSSCSATTCSGGTWGNNNLNYLVGN